MSDPKPPATGTPQSQGASDMAASDRPTARVAEVFWAFLRLGLTSFGGPVAHLGYFRTEFVTRRRWLDDDAYAEIVALCQFLPGPASSQTGFALGLMRAGPLGGLAAFVAFTLPSALVMAALGLGLGARLGAGAADPLLAGAITGLGLVAVAVVAQAVLGMARSLCPDRPRAAIAAVALALVVLWPGSAGMIAAIVLGAGLALALGQGRQTAATPAHEGPSAATEVAKVPGTPLPSRRIGLICLGLVAALVVLGPPLLASSEAGQFLGAMLRAGALVFGGGHVVLPLLEAGTVGAGMIAPEAFVAGYGAAQAMPGPLFTFAAYLGAAATPGGALLAGLGLLAIFLPGLVLVPAVLPFWARLRGDARARAGLEGANAAVVGILGAALYDPVFVHAVGSGTDLALAVALFVALGPGRVPVWLVVLTGAGVGVAAGLWAT